MTPDQAFERDIPERLREDVMVMISEAAHGYTDWESVTILELDRIDAINVRAHGIIAVEGAEYRFIVEDGNRNGTVLEDWEGDKKFTPMPRTNWALQPTADRVNRALASGEGKSLLFKWNAAMRNPQIAKLPGNYAYDRRMQPGMLIENYYRDKAANYGFEIVSDEQAKETRAMLKARAS